MKDKVKRAGGWVRSKGYLGVLGGWVVKVKVHIQWHALQTGLSICLKITVSVFNIFKLLPNPAVTEDGIQIIIM